MPRGAPTLMPAFSTTTARFVCYHVGKMGGFAVRYLVVIAAVCLGAPATAEAVFPSATSEKYSNEKPDKARQRTCLDQYMANKATNGNDGLVWQHKGSGYYSECKKRLK
jgi:hypothetical protein